MTREERPTASVASSERPGAKPRAETAATPPGEALLRMQRSVGNREVVRSLADRRPANETTVRRLALRDTKWEAANKAWTSSDGAVGVLFMDDGTGPVVVKAGESFDEEAIVAGTLLTEVTKGQSKGWSASAPEARKVPADETQRIHAKASALLAPMLNPKDPNDATAQLRKDRTARVLDDLEAGNGVMAYGFAAGAGLGKQLSEEKQTKKKGFLGTKRGLRKDSAAAAFMNDPGLMTMLGRASAGDVFLGNADRFIGKINFDNVMVDLQAKHLSMIDNVELADPQLLRDMPQFNTTGKQGFESWARFDWRQKLVAGDYDGMTDIVMKRVRDEFAKSGTVRKKDKDALLKSFDKQRASMAASFKEGLIQGVANIRSGLLHNVTKLTAGVAPADREMVITNLLARGYFIEGHSVNDAWREAEEMAHLLGGSVKLPKLPDVPPKRGSRRLSASGKPGN